MSKKDDVMVEWAMKIILSKSIPTNRVLLLSPTYHHCMYQDSEGNIVIEDITYDKIASVTNLKSVLPFSEEIEADGKAIMLSITDGKHESIGSYIAEKNAQTFKI